LIITRGFRTYVIGLQVVHSIAIVLPFWFGFIEFYDPLILQVIIIILLTILMWATAIKTLRFKEFKRLELMKSLGAHEIVTYPIVSILIMGEIGVYYALFLLFFPIIWLACFLYIIYGKFMPDV
jgi:hypothetical protein